MGGPPIRVVDLSDRVAGAFCTRLLAGVGYEAVALGGPGRSWRSVSGDPWLATYLRQGVTAVEDRQELRRHLSQADVVVVSADRDGYWREVHDIPHGSQVEVSVDDFDRHGPYATYRGSPLVDWASGGHLFITGLPDRPPLPGPRHLPEYITGYAAAFVAELALVARDRRPAGPAPSASPSLSVTTDRVSAAVSTMELLAGIHQNSFTQYAGTGVVKTRLRHPQPIYPMDIFECADGWACVAVVTDAQYDALVAVIGEPSLLLDERFATPMSRSEHSNAFDAIVAEWFRTRKVDHVVAELQERHVPALRLAMPDQIFDDPQLIAREFWVEGPDGGRMPGLPFRIRTEPSRPPVSPVVPPWTAGRGGNRGGLPLEGLTVVDITEFWSGPSCTRALADFGAAVIRVERPGSRWHRMSAARLQDWKMNRGKLSLAVDLKRQEGVDLVRRLVARAELLVENFRPGVLDRLGLGFPDLLPRSTPLVYLSLSGFGQTGPRAGWASFGPLLEAASSIQARTRYPDGPPMLLGHSLPDPVGGLLGAFLALAAVRQAALDGASRHVDIAQLEAYVACCGEELLRASVGAPTPRSPEVSGVFAARGVDSWVVVEADGEDEVARLLARLHAPGLAPAPGQEGDVQAAVAAALSGLDRFAVTSDLQSHGVAAFPVLSVADLVHDEGLRRSGFLVEVPYEGRTATMPGMPYRGLPYRPDLATAVAPAGHHTRSILGDYLGLEEGEIKSMLQRGIVADADHSVD